MTTPRQTLLIIEDDPDVLKGISLRLQASGYAVVAARDATQALSAARNAKPALILLDLGLPGGDGFLVMDRFKSIAQLALIPILVISGRDPALNRDKALQKGAVAFLQKPVDTQVLLAAIEAALGGA